MAAEEKEVLLVNGCFRIVCQNGKYGLKRSFDEHTPDFIKKRGEQILACEYDFIYPSSIYNQNFLSDDDECLFFVKQGEVYGYFYSDFGSENLCYPTYSRIHHMSDSLLQAYVDEIVSVIDFRKGGFVYQVEQDYDDAPNDEIIQLGWTEWEGRREPVLNNIFHGIVHPWEIPLGYTCAEIGVGGDNSREAIYLLIYENQKRIGVIDHTGNPVMSPEFDRIKVEYKLTGYKGNKTYEALVPLYKNDSIIRRRVAVHIICEMELYSDKWCYPYFIIDDIWLTNSEQNPSLTLSDCFSIALSDLSQQGKRSCVFIPGSSYLFKMPAAEVVIQSLEALNNYFKTNNSFDSIAILCENPDEYNDYVSGYYEGDWRQVADGYSVRTCRTFDYIDKHETCDYCEGRCKPRHWAFEDCEDDE